MSAREEEIIALIFGGCWLVVSLVTLLLTLLHQAALARALSACAPRHRTLEPGLVWLNLVPAFHLFWKFWTAAQVANSVRQEFRGRGLRTDQAFGTVSGRIGPTIAVLTRCVMFGGYTIAWWMRSEEVLALGLILISLLGPAEVVFLLVHWTQVSTLTRQLNAGQPAAASAAANWQHDETGPERDFDEDYRPVPRRTRRNG